jgi:hypothetical protein
MTGYQSKKAAALDEDGMYLMHQTAQEPVAPQRPWVGLTDEEAQWLYDNCRTPSNLMEIWNKTQG